MLETTQCFERLGLDSGADARSVRRAYARELKQIDQVRDAAAFQRLREAYEIALHVATLQASAPVDVAGAVDEPTVRTSDVASQTTGDDPGQLANAAFESLGAVRGGLVDQAAWESALVDVLAGDDLVNMTARVVFESHIVHVLAHGWQAGHEFLFPAAAKVFCWIDDARRLPQFGHAGLVVGEAVEDFLLFAVQPSAQQDAQREVMARLRDAKEPTPQALRHWRFHFDTLAARFPEFFALTTNAESRERWRLLYSDMPLDRTPFSVDEEVLARYAASMKKELAPWYSGAAARGLILLVVMAAARVASNSSSPPESVPETFRPLTELQSPAQREEPIPDARLNDIAERIVYAPQAKGAAQLSVTYEVLLGTDRTVAGLNKLDTSGDAKFDEAVAKAIRESPRFPPNSVMRFKATYTFHKGPRPKV